MAQEPTTVVASDDAEETRRPYIVVLMSQEMKDAVKKYADEHDTNPTALARKLLAETVGYDLSSEPATATRKKYNTAEEKDAAHKLASKKSGLLRKALFQVHTAQIHAKKELLRVANSTVLALSDDHDMASLEALDGTLTAAIKANK